MHTNCSCLNSIAFTTGFGNMVSLGTTYHIMTLNIENYYRIETVVQKYFKLHYITFMYLDTHNYAYTVYIHNHIIWVV